MMSTLFFVTTTLQSAGHTTIYDVYDRLTFEVGFEGWPDKESVLKMIAEEWDRIDEQRKTQEAGRGLVAESSGADGTAFHRAQAGG